MSRSPNADLRRMCVWFLLTSRCCVSPANAITLGTPSLIGSQTVLLAVVKKRLTSKATPRVPLYTWTAVYLFIMFQHGLWRCVSTAGTSGFPPTTRMKLVFAGPVLTLEPCADVFWLTEISFRSVEGNKHQTGHKLARDCSWRLGYHFCCCRVVCSQNWTTQLVDRTWRKMSSIGNIQ